MLQKNVKDNALLPQMPAVLSLMRKKSGSILRRRPGEASGKLRPYKVQPIVTFCLA
jgi:hypothetical protein